MLRPKACAFACLTLIAGTSVFGQSGEAPTGSDLANEARAAAKEYRAVGPDAVTAARGEVESAMAGLDRFLRTGAAQKAAGWKRYLRWDELKEATSSDAPLADVINVVREKLMAEQTGLELPVFVRLREALDRFRQVRGAASDSKAEGEFGRRLEGLATQLTAYSQDPSNGDAAVAIGRALAWLENNRQAGELVSKVRQTYGKPNFFGRVSHRFAAVGVERDIDQVTGVRDSILGTDLHGTARMVGRSSLALVEDPDEARLDILLGGTAWSNNVGYNGPVTIFSTGTTNISGRKQILLNADGFFAYAAQASTGTRSNIHDLCANCGLIERIAWKRAAQQKGPSEQIASQHAAARVAAQMNQEVGGQIADANERFQRMRRQLVRRGQFPEDLTFSSTPGEILVRMLQVGPESLAAPGDAPAFGNAQDLALRAHESSVNNFAAGLMGGVELTDLRLEKLIRDDLQEEVPEELQVTMPDGKLDPEKEPWSIIFARELPVRVRFNKGRVVIAIRADGFTRGEGDEPGKYRPALTELVEIAAVYVVEQTDIGATLKRDGDVQVRYPNRTNPDQITLRDSPIATFIRRKFRSLFKEEFVGQGLMLKKPYDRAGTLRLSELAIDGGWAVLGWTMPADSAPADSAPADSAPAAAASVTPATVPLSATAAAAAIDLE